MKRAGADRCELVVLWLSNEAFGGRPLSRLAGLFGQLAPADEAPEARTLVGLPSSVRRIRLASAPC